MPLAVLSNKLEAATRGIVAGLFGADRFRVVHGERPGTPRKPDPAPALAIARALGVPPSRCLFVGDSATDLETARRAGMIPVAVLWGFRRRAELAAAGARCFIARPADLLPLVARLPE